MTKLETVISEAETAGLEIIRHESVTIIVTDRSRRSGLPIDGVAIWANGWATRVGLESSRAFRADGVRNVLGLKGASMASDLRSLPLPVQAEIRELANEIRANADGLITMAQAVKAARKEIGR